MTKEEIVQKLVKDLEVRGRSIGTIRDYTSKVSLYQDYFGKPADQMGEAEIYEYLHYLHYPFGEEGAVSIRLFFRLYGRFRDFPFLFLLHLLRFHSKMKTSYSP